MSSKRNSADGSLFTGLYNTINSIGDSASEMANSVAKFTKKLINSRQFKKEQSESVCAPYIVKDESRLLDKCKSDRTCKRLSSAKLIKSVHPKSCLTSEALIKIVTAYNAAHPDRDAKIPFNPKAKSIAEYNQLWEALNSKIRAEYGDKMLEHKWLDLPFMKAKLSEKDTKRMKYNHYRPEVRPEWHTSPADWVRTSDINKVLNHYTYKYPDFMYYGALPMDFNDKNPSGECKFSSICELNMKDIIAKKYKYIGVVFNWSRSDDANGSHWTSLFVNIPSGVIGYMDSNGLPPWRPVYDLMVNIREQCKKLGVPMKIKVNRVRHQYENTECGIYAINFICEQLDGKSFEQVSKRRISDIAINSKRREFYSY